MRGYYQANISQHGFPDSLFAPAIHVICANEQPDLHSWKIFENDFMLLDAERYSRRKEPDELVISAHSSPEALSMTCLSTFWGGDRSSSAIIRRIAL